MINICDLGTIKITDKINLFVGSGISMWGEDRAPSGQEISIAIINYLSEEIDKLEHKKIFTEECKKIPFEVLNDCLDSDEMLDIIIELCGKSKPNNIHRAVKKLIEKGFIKNIITTNYDLCLDGVVEFNKVVKLCDINKYENVLFKLHGTAENNLSESIVYRLKQEGNLDPWKVKYLRQLLGNCDLLFIGYSGIDYDIIPVIEEIEINRIIWNFFDKKNLEISRGLNALSKNKEVECVLGDMRQLLTKIIDDDYIIYKEKNDSNCEEMVSILLKHRISSINKTKWLIEVCNRIGFPVICENIVKRKMISCPEVAQCYFQMGRYWDSAKLYKNLSRVGKTEYEVTNRKLDYIDSIRCFGKQKKAKYTLLEILNKNHIDNDEIKLKIINKLLLLEKNSIHKRNIKDIINNGDKTIGTCKDINEINQYLFLKQILGYKEENKYFSFDNVNYNIGVEQKKREIDNNILDKDILISYYAGRYPEVWKNIIKKKKINIVELKMFAISFTKCQYSFKRRLIGIMLKR